MGRRILLFTLALILAVGGTGAVLAYVSKADSRALAKEQPVVVVTAQHDIAAGTSVKDAQAKGWLVTTQIPRKTVPLGAVTDVAALNDEIALTTVYSGQIVMPSLFGTKAPTTSGLTLTPGTLAVSVQADDPMHVGSFLSPGAEVAVFDTYNSYTGDAPPWTPSGDGISEDFKVDRATRLLLARVRVLAVGTATSTGSAKSADATTAPGAAASPAALLTLEVVQADAEKLIHATQTGHLYFALVNEASKIAPSGGIDNRTLFGGK
ncbi:MAG: pilus assembly protein CpaB [Frankiales bacterium]|jgi:pilus assembly protein CpaB|nr:pilus assembly protein CpaB [Frankiales bacterium]